MLTQCDHVEFATSHPVLFHQTNHRCTIVLDLKIQGILRPEEPLKLLLAQSWALNIQACIRE